MITTIKVNIFPTIRKYQELARRYPQAMKQATRDLAGEALIDYDKTIATWVHQPQFDIVDVPQGTAVQTESQIYKFIDRGTRVRRALMSKDWRSKTKVNVLASYSGQGRVLYISRKLALPGIEARNFSQMVAQRIRDKAPERVKKALDDAARESGF